MNGLRFETDNEFVEKYFKPRMCISIYIHMTEAKNMPVVKT